MSAPAAPPAGPTLAGPTLAFWQQRFESQRTPWDRGTVHPALAPLVASGALPAGARVLVPGCGAGHEVLALAASGLRPVGVDYAPAAVEFARARLAQVGLAAEVVQADLLEWMPSVPFDAIWDQACLCALHPDHWIAYAARLAAWLRPGGTLALLAVQVEREGRREGRIEGPPYHCDVNAVRALFSGERWQWPRPPYPRHTHPAGFAELQVVLTRVAESRGAG
ncbi:MAG TPA: methyltransferase domain-containing protein [Zeimonas sp.]|nr:methyltransferase domain-containing protein [Zeimonas sp.]